MVRVKICGITNLEDALASLFFGADAVGFVFYKKSPRYISPSKAANISRILSDKIIRVGVFVNEKEKVVKKIARLCGLDMLQFHGEESPAYCRRFKGYKVIKAFRVAKSIDLDALYRYKTFAYLFDTYSKSEPGGTGKKFNWNLFKQAVKIKKPVFLSGGLSCGNVQRAVKLLKPDWVDASSALELKPGTAQKRVPASPIRPGKKDHKKIRKFIQAAKPHGGKFYEKMPVLRGRDPG